MLLWFEFGVANEKEIQMIQLSLDDIRTLVSGERSHSFEIGKAYLIRTVTMHYTGRVVAVTDSDVVLEDAAWIADTGRFGTALANGSLSEIEPYPDRVAVCRGGMIDFAEWTHSLPRTQK